jgi:hypothetical protein
MDENSVSLTPSSKFDNTNELSKCIGHKINVDTVYYGMETNDYYLVGILRNVNNYSGIATFETSGGFVYVYIHTIVSFSLYDGSVIV